jgi:hypothetical protein
MSSISGNRRTQQRFSVSLPVTYRADGISREGRVSDLSRHGIGFLTSGTLRIGADINFEIDLPLERNGGPVQLILRGKIVRSEFGFAAARISRRAFQTVQARRVLVAGA